MDSLPTPFCKVNNLHLFQLKYENFSLSIFAPEWQKRGCFSRREGEKFVLELHAWDIFINFSNFLSLFHRIWDYFGCRFERINSFPRNFPPLNSNLLIFSDSLSPQIKLQLGAKPNCRLSLHANVTSSLFIVIKILCATGSIAFARKFLYSPWQKKMRTFFCSHPQLQKFHSIFVYGWFHNISNLSSASNGE